MDHNALRSWHAIMYKFVTSMVHCGLGMQQCAMHNATIQKRTFFELGVYVVSIVLLPLVHQNQTGNFSALSRYSIAVPCFSRFMQTNVFFFVRRVLRVLKTWNFHPQTLL